MSFRLKDFKCKQCNHEWEEFLDLRNIEPGESTSFEIRCPECESPEWEEVLRAGKGSGKHISWSKWRVDLGK